MDGNKEVKSMFGLYDYIYNKVENAELAIKDTVSRATCPDVDSYIEKNMTSNNKKQKKKGNKETSYRCVIFMH